MEKEEIDRMEEDIMATEAIEVVIEVIEGLETADLHQEE